jgi:hypothetical protein
MVSDAMARSFYTEGAPLSREGLFQLVVEEVLRDRVVDERERTVLTLLAHALKLANRDAGEIVAAARERVGEGEPQGSAPLDTRALYARVVHLACANGLVDHGEEELLAALRRVLEVQESTHEALVLFERASRDLQEAAGGSAPEVGACERVLEVLLRVAPVAATAGAYGPVEDCLRPPLLRCAAATGGAAASRLLLGIARALAASGSDDQLQSFLVAAGRLAHDSGAKPIAPCAWQAFAEICPVVSHALLARGRWDLQGDIAGWLARIPPELSGVVVGPRARTLCGWVVLGPFREPPETAGTLAALDELLVLAARHLQIRDVALSLAGALGAAGLLVARLPERARADRLVGHVRQLLALHETDAEIVEHVAEGVATFSAALSKEASSRGSGPAAGRDLIDVMAELVATVALQFPRSASVLAARRRHVLVARALSHR